MLVDRSDAKSPSEECSRDSLSRDAEADDEGVSSSARERFLVIHQ
jgi:hypothetical protein